MGLERLLNVIKQATPAINRKPRASAIIARGTLTQIMKRHLDNGFTDNRGHAQRKALREQGVKVNLRKAREKGKSTERWHIRYGNAHAAELMRTTQGPVQDWDAARKTGVSNWARLSADEQAAFKAKWNSDRQLPASDADDDQEQSQVKVPRVSVWDTKLGNEDWGLAPCNLEASLKEQVDNRFQQIRDQVSSSYLVKDRQQIGPDQKK